MPASVYYSMEEGSVSDADTITGPTYDERPLATRSTTLLPSFTGTNLLPAPLSPTGASPSDYGIGMTSEPQSNRERGARSSIICDGCRKRRTKCDRSSPCGACTKRNKTCTYDDSEVSLEFSGALLDAHNEIARLNKVVKFLVTRVKAKEDREATNIVAKKDMEASLEQGNARNRAIGTFGEMRGGAGDGGRQESQYLRVDEAWMDARPNSAPAYLDGAIFHEQQLNSWGFQ